MAGCGGAYGGRVLGAGSGLGWLLFGVAGRSVAMSVALAESRQMVPHPTPEEASPKKQGVRNTRGVGRRRIPKIDLEFHKANNRPQTQDKDKRGAVEATEPWTELSCDFFSSCAWTTTIRGTRASLSTMDGQGTGQHPCNSEGAYRRDIHVEWTGVELRVEIVVVFELGQSELNRRNR